MLALLLVLCLQQDAVQESDHELAAGAAVTVRTVTGRVRMRGTDKAVAHVRTVKRGRDAELVEFRIESTKDKLTVETKYPKPRRDLQMEIEIDVDVPRTVKTLGADVVSGSIEVKDARGEATLKTVSGPIDVDGHAGDLTASAISGDMRIARLSGDRVAITTTSGTVKAAAEVGTLVLTSVSGGAELDLAPKGGDWSVKASCVSGNLLLRLPESAGAKVDLKTLSGDLESEFELKDSKRSDRRDVDRFLRGVLGDGAGTVRASTISGDVKLGRTK